MDEPLGAALRLGDLTTIKASTLSNVDDAVDQDGKTPLHLAAQYGHAHIVQHLLIKKADVNALDEEGHTPLHLGAQQANPEVLNVLLRNKADTAAVTRRQRYTPLHLAVQQRQAEAVRVLLQAGADVNAAAKERVTPLHLAAESGELSVTRLLVEAHAAVDAKDQVGWAPLHLAVERRHNALAELLLVLGAHPNTANKHGYTPLHVAATSGNLAAVRLLLQHGASKTAHNTGCKTPYDLAVQAEHAHLLTLLRPPVEVEEPKQELQVNGAEAGADSAAAAEEKVGSITGMVAGMGRLLAGRKKMKSQLRRSQGPFSGKHGHSAAATAAAAAVAAAGGPAAANGDAATKSFLRDQVSGGASMGSSCSSVVSSKTAVADTTAYCPFCAQVGPRHQHEFEEHCQLGEAASTRSSGVGPAADADVPEMFLCPLSKKLLRDPVVACDGYTYDRSTIAQWFEAAHKESPITGVELRSRATLPNFLVKSAVQEWLEWRKGLLK